MGDFLSYEHFAHNLYSKKKKKRQQQLELMARSSKTRTVTRSFISTTRITLQDKKLLGQPQLRSLSDWRTDSLDFFKKT